MDKGKEVFLSIIIPVYNVGKYVEDCLKSVLKQDIAKEEYEVICINDGSTDNSLEVLRAYEKEYPNVKVIDKENGGVCTARNAGLDVAIGKYIWFIDGDDCIRQNCLKTLKDVTEKHFPEVVLLKVQRVTDDFALENASPCALTFLVDDNKDDICTVTESLFRSDILQNNHIRFHEGIHYGEDFLFQYYVSVYRQGKCRAVINEPLYFYRQTPNSAMRTRNEVRWTRQTKDFWELSKVYKKEYDDKISDDKRILKKTKVRQYWATEAILCVLPKSSLDYKATMQGLKADGLYPYPMILGKFFTAKGLKGKLVQFPKLFFRFEWLYKIYYKVARKKK